MNRPTNNTLPEQVHAPLASGLWAIEPEALPGLAERLRSAASENAGAAPEDRPACTVRDGLAVVNVTGAMSKNGLAFGPFVLLESMRGLAASLRLAADRPDVRAILLRVDSPGGTVDGITELAGAVSEAATKKPLYAYADGLMASAAYWMSCGAREIAASEVAQVGSIGVISVQQEWSKALAEFGITANVIRSGSYKAVGNPYEPLSEDARAYMQAASDDVYALFLDAVAKGRRCGRDKAEGMADGKLFMGTAAREAGLVDRVESLETFIQHIKEMHAMNLNDLKENHASALAEYRAEVERELAETGRAAVASATEQERNRLTGLVRACFGERHAESFTVIAALGVSAETVNAMKSALADLGKTVSAGLELVGKAVPGGGQNAAALESMREAHAQGISMPCTAGTFAPQAEEQDFETLVADYAKKNGCAKSAAMSAVAADNPEAHRAWIAKVNQQ